MELLQGYQFLSTSCTNGEEYIKKIFISEKLTYICQQLLETLELESSNQLKVKKKKN